MMRKPFIAGNWKMNLGLREAENLATELKASLKGIGDREVALFPTFVSVPALVRLLEDSPIQVGGQNCYHEPDGAFTGEISATILRSTGASRVILGHSERRHVLGESDEIVNLKMKAALAGGLDPILCIGETIEEREGGRTMDVVARQIRAGLAGIDRGTMARITLAYEPVWAIGTGKTATPELAQEVHAGIRALVEELQGRPAAQDMRIQYGGSVKANNVDDLMAMPDIDGALVGGASLDAASFARIVKFEVP